VSAEIQATYTPGAVLYNLIFAPASGAMVWNTALSGFQDFANGSYSGYPLSMTGLGSTSLYTASMPTPIPPGVYNVVAKRQAGATPAITDPTVAQGELQWGGSAVGVVPLSSLATSGQISQFLPTRMSKGHMVRNLTIYLKSAADHISPLLSGIVSGQIIRNSGTFGPLESGAIVELGQGFYNLQALTSGDMNADTIALLFTATSVSGPMADPLPMSIVTQRG
jgi:hypothetical protein